MQSPKPSLGLNAAMEFGIFHEMHKDEIVSLRSTPQEQEWHPEGDAWTHTLMVADEAAKIIREENLEKEDALVVMLGAFCHDFGKPQTTKFESGKTRSLGHEEAGKDPANKFLSDIGIEASLREPILKIVANHLKPSEHYINEVRRGKPVADGVFNRLAKKIYPATLKQLVLVAKADHLGRGPFVDPTEPEKHFIPIDYPAGDWFLERAKKLNIVKEIPPHIIQGRDLIALGFKPGTEFGEVIKLADALRDEKEFKKEDALFLIYENKDKSIKDLIIIMKNKLAASEGEVVGEGIAAE